MKIRDVARISISDSMLLVGIGIGVFYWVLDSFIHIFLSPEVNFFQRLLGTDIYEVWTRLVALLLFVFFGSHAHFTINRWIKAERDLKKSEEKYRLLFENANDAIFVVQDDVVKFPNPSALSILGYSEEELSKLPLVNLVHPEDRHIVRERYKRRLKGEKVPGSYSLRLINKDHEELWLEMNNVITEWEGKPAGVYFTRDITQQKLLEEQFYQAQKMEALGTLAGGIAHDFNNILSAIMGYTELSLNVAQEEGPLRRRLNEIYKASYRAKDLVHQILSFSRQMESERKPIRLHLIVKEALKLLRASLPTTIEFREEIATQSDTVRANPTQVHQVLMNLCTNAHHAMMEKGGVLEMTLAPLELDDYAAASYPDLLPGPYLRLTVSDTGRGMDRATLERIFEPYFTTKEKGVGTGLGLAVVHGIVKRHGGAITVTSEVGKGTAFNILLPRIETETVEEAELLEPLPTGHERILFVDDEETLVEMGGEMLKELGYEFVGSTSSLEALETFRAQPDGFDLVITDMTMPDKTGLELAREMMAIRPDIPIILCTGFSGVTSEERAKAIGIREFMLKPLLMRELANTIRKVLG